jgi:hypothetical protein
MEKNLFFFPQIFKVGVGSKHPKVDLIYILVIF